MQMFCQLLCGLIILKIAAGVQKLHAFFSFYSFGNNKFFSSSYLVSNEKYSD